MDRSGSRQSGRRSLRINPAHASHQEAIKGSITPGKLADLVVISMDILTAPPERLLDAKVVMTVFGGRINFEEGTAPGGSR